MFSGLCACKMLANAGIRQVSRVAKVLPAGTEPKGSIFLPLRIKKFGGDKRRIAKTPDNVDIPFR